MIRFRSTRLSHLFTIASILLLSAGASVRAQYLGWDKQEQARTHNTDLQHIELHISFDQPAKKLFGTVLTTLSVLPQSDSVREIVFDATELNIEKIWQVDGKREIALKFDTAEANKLHILFPHAVEYDKPMTIGIQYSTLPRKKDKGIYFMGPDTVYTDRPYQIWTQGEGEDNHWWFPTYDYPNDKTTTEMYVTVRADQSALSNGKLAGKSKNKDGSVIWHWVMNQPHSTYLVMLGIGNYEVVQDKWQDKPVDYWVYPGWGKEAHRIFGLTPDMIDFFSKKTGVDYPWPKYDQIAIADFQFGGMENTTATTLNDYVLFDKKTGVHFSSEGLIAHELAHQWFGDYVTCRSWINMWMNESFATFFEALYREHHDGEDEFQEENQGSQNAGLGAEMQLGKKPIVAANNYTANIYPRGATVLNMMRHVLGEDGWWKTIHHYLDVHKFNNVEANDLKIAAEEVTGQNLSWFFDEWLYKDGHPIYDVTYKYEPENALVRMIVNQTQPRDSMTGTFKMPIDVEIVYEDGQADLQTIRDQDSTQTFTLICPKKPVNVIFDKGNSTLKEVHVHKSVNEWLYQLQHSVPAIERSEAAEELGGSDYAGDPSVIDALSRTATGDKFWATRSYALTSLAHVTDSLKGYEKLVVDEATKDPNPDVRQNAVWLLPRLSDHALALQGALQAVDDSSYQIHGSAIRVVNKLDRKRGYELALKALGEKSPRDNVRYAAIQILRENKTEEALDRLITLIGERNIPKRTRWETINAIGDFAEFDSVKTYTALWNLTKNGDRDIIVTAYNRLGDIGGAQTLLRIKREAQDHRDLDEMFMNIRERMHKRLDPALIKEQQEQLQKSLDAKKPK